ncbi:MULTISPECIES: hypothetical protein [Haloferax]|uniref:Uncharacterized protein n=1 Tax=Haloferax massiliensis TaxID=1476858 RepID=A0A0D6JUB4_9EURY|nr:MULTISPECIES: hypothetical protein [Haloferax]MDS0241452.1 hypothetical protein [Haloferax sp. S2CR25]MDS0444573.1 hypothetical protein [Haloferax sp. S2CR25-2]CQR52074.1 hypothetical protein BN996_02965 [Haloferax massiliensis]
MHRLRGNRGDDASQFAARLRRLDVETFARLVSDLWVERGRSVARDGATITVGDGSTPRSLVVTHRPPSAVAGDVVVTSRLSDDPSVVDAAELLDVVRYAVDRDRSAEILAGYLGPSADRFCSPRFDSADESRGVDRLTTLTSGAVVAVVAVFLFAGVGVVFTHAGLTPVVDSPATATADQREGELTTATARPKSETDAQGGENGSENAPADVETVSYSAIGCPAPPRNVRPAELAPAVVPGASAGGLDGWRQSPATSDPPDEPDRLRDPTARHAVTYVPPSGHRLTLEISLWPSLRAAQSDVSAFAPRNETVVRWGQYTLVVSGTTPDGDPLARDRTTVWSRPLLSEVRSPSGSRLGYRCLDSLLDESAPSTAAPPTAP